MQIQALQACKALAKFTLVKQTCALRFNGIICLFSLPDSSCRAMQVKTQQSHKNENHAQSRYGSTPDPECSLPPAQTLPPLPSKVSRYQEPPKTNFPFPYSEKTTSQIHLQIKLSTINGEEPYLFV